MTDIIKLTPVYDRSRVVQDWKCPRSRYWNYEYEGRGIVPANEPLELSMGIAIHDALAVIATLTQKGEEVDIDRLAAVAYEQMYEALWNPELPSDAKTFAQEQATLVEGLIRGFYKFRWPQLLAQYPKIVLTEGEMSYNHDGLKFMSKPDLVLANDDEAVYIEYKSTSSRKDAWINSWATAVQLHSTIKAVKETTGISVDSVIVQGLYKGYESYGKQSSPFCYAYKKNGHPPFSNDEIAYEYRSGMKRIPTWELPGGVKKWVEEMPDVVLMDQFPQTPPIYIKEDLVDAFFKQRALREHEIKGTMELILHPSTSEDRKQHYLDATFPQRFDQCNPSFGKGCPYNKLCHGPSVDPIEAGYQWRNPHHADEEERFKDAES